MLLSVCPSVCELSVAVCCLFGRVLTRPSSVESCGEVREATRRLENPAASTDPSIKITANSCVRTRVLAGIPRKNITGARCTASDRLGWSFPVIGTEGARVCGGAYTVVVLVRR